MARKSERVTLKVTPERKARWESYVDEDPEYDGLTDLVTLAVEREISGALDRDAVRDLDLAVDFDLGALEDIDEHVREMAERLGRLDDRVADVEATIKTDDDISELARELYEELPSFRNAQGLDTKPDSEMTPDERLRHDSTPDAWANLYEVTTEDARRALSRATELFPDAEWTETDDGRRRYYRIDRYPGEIKDG